MQDLLLNLQIPQDAFIFTSAQTCLKVALHIKWRGRHQYSELTWSSLTWKTIKHPKKVCIAMPGIIVFQRRWSVGSDDLFAPASFLVIFHLIWYVWTWSDYLLRSLSNIHIIDILIGHLFWNYYWYNQL